MHQAKYADLANWIENKIKLENYKVGDRLWSENELSVMFEVSRQTVREAIRLLVHKGILETRQGSGTYVRSTGRLVRKQSMVIGVITTYIDTYIFPKIISGVESVLSENGYSMQLAFTRNRTESERQILSNMLEQEVDGFIIEPAKSGLPNANSAQYRSIVNRNIPAVFLNGYFPEIPIPHVSMDDRMAGYLATDCLIRAGHKRILAMLKFDDCQGRLRYQGYLDAMGTACILTCDEDVFWYSTETQDQVLEQSILKQKIKNYTGVVCYNDELAIRLLQQCKQWGISIPKDLSIVGIDNSELSSNGETPITSVAHPKEELGIAAASRLLYMLAGKDSLVIQQDYTPYLVERDSVAPCKEKFE